MDTSETYKKLSDEASPLKPDYIVERVKWYEDPIYIKMCDCEEIQKKRPDYGELQFFHFDGFGNSIWLPRQDELQEIARPNWRELPYLLTTTFNEAVNGGSCSYVWDNGKHFTSMEQLWLAFVQKELHNKVWDGEKWK